MCRVEKGSLEFLLVIQVIQFSKIKVPRNKNSFIAGGSDEINIFYLHYKTSIEFIFGTKLEGFKGDVHDDVKELTETSVRLTFHSTAYVRKSTQGSQVKRGHSEMWLPTDTSFFVSCAMISTAAIPLFLPSTFSLRL